MVENKKGLLITGIITLATGIVPVWLDSTSKIFSFMLAVFGSALLSFTICLINYIVARKQILSAIIHETFFLEIQSKIQDLINNNTLTVKQVIHFSSFVRDLLLKEFDKIDLFVAGLFPFIDKRLKKRVLDYRKDLYDNIYEKYNEIYLVFTSCHESDTAEMKEDFEKYFFDLVTYQDFLYKKNKIANPKYKLDNEKYDIDKFILNFREKIKQDTKKDNLT